MLPVIPNRSFISLIPMKVMPSMMVWLLFCIIMDLKERTGEQMARIRKADWLTDEGLTKIKAWARNGMTNEQIAQQMGCSRQTLQKWIKETPEMDAALREGKELVDIKVENSLLKRAMGFEYTEEVATPSGEVLKVQRYEKPDVTAIIFWLKNRKPNVWRNKEQVDIEKIVAQTELTKAKTELLKGETKDTTLLQHLIDVVNEDD